MAARKKTKRRAKRRTTKTPTRKRRPVALKTAVKKTGCVPNRAGHYVYSVSVQGETGRLTLPNIVARTASEAERVGKRLFRSSV